jgi:alkylation response protein AidB-like acyl-CoA dehydrogenase
MAGAFLQEDAQPRLMPDGRPDVIEAVFPATSCTILDTWQTAGLRGTGSHDFEVKDLFVPLDYTFPLTSLFSRPSLGYRLPFEDIGPPMLASVSLGIARDVLESFKKLASVKTPTGGAGKLAGQANVQERYGRVEAQFRASHAYLYQTANALGDDSNSNLDPLAGPARLASAYVAESAAQIVDQLFDMGGGSAIYESSRLERCFRDVHMVPHHYLLGPSAYIAAARAEIGAAAA